MPFKMDWNKIPEGTKQLLRDNKLPHSGHFWKNKDGSIGQPYFCSANNVPKDENGKIPIVEVTEMYINWFKK